MYVYANKHKYIDVYINMIKTKKEVQIYWLSNHSEDFLILNSHWGKT